MRSAIAGIDEVTHSILLFVIGTPACEDFVKSLSYYGGQYANIREGKML